jgi:hypothetical protein
MGLEINEEMTKCIKRRGLDLSVCFKTIGKGDDDVLYN